MGRRDLRLRPRRSPDPAGEPHSFPRCSEWPLDGDGPGASQRQLELRRLQRGCDLVRRGGPACGRFPCLDGRDPYPCGHDPRHRRKWMDSRCTPAILSQRPRASRSPSRRCVLRLAALEAQIVRSFSQHHRRWRSTAPRRGRCRQSALEPARNVGRRGFDYTRDVLGRTCRRTWSRTAADTGDIVQRMDYDPRGQGHPRHPVRFPALWLRQGLYDRDTKLVRFGARD